MLSSNKHNGLNFSLNRPPSPFDYRFGATGCKLQCNGTVLLWEYQNFYRYSTSINVCIQKYCFPL